MADRARPSGGPSVYGYSVQDGERVRASARARARSSSSGAARMPQNTQPSRRRAPVVDARRRTSRASPPTAARGSRVARHRCSATSAREPLDEVVDARRRARDRRCRAGSRRPCRRDVVVADDQHVRHLLELRLADARCRAARRPSTHVDAEALGLQPVDDLRRRSRRGRRRPAARATCTGASHAGNAPA